LEVRQGETVIGTVVRDEEAGWYRYFPGADNDVAFVFEHRSLRMLLRLIETRSWEAELRRLGRQWACA
jgi:hypothetical protein